MAYQSILFVQKTSEEINQDADFLKDLNINQIIKATLGGKAEYKLESFFHMPLENTEDILYRQEIVRELENQELFQSFVQFGSKMRDIRKIIADISNLYYIRTKERCLLEAVSRYCESVENLSEFLNDNRPKASGLSMFLDYLSDYIGSEKFIHLKHEVSEIITLLDSVQYSLHIKGNRIDVQRNNGAANYSTEIQEFFNKFRQGEVPVYQYKFKERDLNHVEANIIDLVARLYPDTFNRLHNFAEENGNFILPAIQQFDSEIQFYISWLEYIRPMKQRGLNFCIPELSDSDKNIFGDTCFDLALAANLIYTEQSIVCNQFCLKGKERMIIVTGPNQGGKTTFARMIVQLHYFASLGLPVPGIKAKLFLPDTIYTHFERQESQATLSGKLQDDIIRIHEVLTRASPYSLIIINEMFASTTLQDAVWLGKRVMEQISDLDALCVYVTFLEELSAYNDKTVSMVSTVGPDSQARTYKIIRKPADGRAYATSIAQKYGLTYEEIVERIDRADERISSFS